MSDELVRIQAAPRVGGMVLVQARDGGSCSMHPSEGTGKFRGGIGLEIAEKYLRHRRPGDQGILDGVCGDRRGCGRCLGGMSRGDESKDCQP